jgi:hypothetical protein
MNPEKMHAPPPKANILLVLLAQVCLHEVARVNRKLFLRE